jgi:hypothetical protein
MLRRCRCAARFLLARAYAHMSTSQRTPRPAWRDRPAPIGKRLRDACTIAWPSPWWRRRTAPAGPTRRMRGCAARPRFFLRLAPSLFPPTAHAGAARYAPRIGQLQLMDTRADDLPRPAIRGACRRICRHARQRPFPVRRRLQMTVRMTSATCAYPPASRATSTRLGASRKGCTPHAVRRKRQRRPRGAVPPSARRRRW